MKDEVVCANGKIYKEYEPVEFDQKVIKLKGGRVKVIRKVERITVTNYQNIVIIDSKLFTEVKKKC